MLTFLISLNSMSISLIADDMSWIFLSVFWMIVINKLLLCNSSDNKVYIYKDYKTYEDKISLTSGPWGITVVPCTDKAVVTLPPPM
jgi:hypothetical protein